MPNHFAGWIKLARLLLCDPILLKPDLLQLYIYCLLRANYKDREIIFNDEKTVINVGSFITSRGSIADFLNINESTIYKRLKKLEKLNYITLKSNRYCTIVNLTDTSIFTGETFEQEHQSNSKITKKEHFNNTDNKYNKDKNINNIFIHWNSKNIIIHRALSEKLCSIIKNKLTEYSENEIIEAINNYNTVITGEGYYFNHKWTLSEFLGNDKFETFLSINKPLENYQCKITKSETEKQGINYPKYQPQEIKRGHFLDTREASLDFILKNLNNKYFQHKVEEAKQKWNINDNEILHSVTNML